jgi:hypothetical protein
VRRRNEKMKAMRDSGMTLQSIGDRYGISRERVRQLTADFTAEEDRVLRAAWRTREPRNTIALKLGRDPSSIKARVRILGLPQKPRALKDRRKQMSLRKGI